WAAPPAGREPDLKLADAGLGFASDAVLRAVGVCQYPEDWMPSEHKGLIHLASLEAVASPDGRYVAYSGPDLWGSAQSPPRQVGILDAASLRPVVLADALPLDAFRPRWTTDGRSVVYTA